MRSDHCGRALRIGGISAEAQSESKQHKTGKRQFT